MKERIDKIRAATTGLDFELMEQEPDFQKISDFALIITDTTQQIIMEVEGVKDSSRQEGKSTWIDPY